MISGILELDISNLQHLPEAACKVLTFAGDRKIFAFSGPMGAGKTTFIKTFCAALGSQDNFSSPTYAILNEYASPKGKVYHFDLYRIKDVKELYDLGFEEYLGSNNYCFVEWPEIAADFFSGSSYMGINFVVNGKMRRIIAENHG